MVNTGYVTFGFGLSYSSFSVEAGTEGKDVAEGLTICAKVTDKGAYKGKEVVQVYCQAPQGALGKPARSLCGFAKTKELAPGEAQMLRIPVSPYTIASYDDSRALNPAGCWRQESMFFM